MTNNDSSLPAMGALAEFLFAAPASRTTPAIIAWWERRRLAYNGWVGAAGLVSLVTVSSYAALSGGEEVFPGALIAAAVFGGMANLCYFFGPATELLLEKLWGRRVMPTGPLLYRVGLTFSVGLALFPTLLTAMLVTLRLMLALLGLQWD